jgi:hypothetical protein
MLQKGHEREADAAREARSAEIRLYGVQKRAYGGRRRASIQP